MDHDELMADVTYAGWPEHRQEAHRALCLAAYHYAAVAYEPGPIMDTIAAQVLGDQGHDQGVHAREALARAVLALPLPSLDRPQRISLPGVEYGACERDVEALFVRHDRVPTYPRSRVLPGADWTVPPWWAGQ